MTEQHQAAQEREVDMYQFVIDMPFEDDSPDALQRYQTIEERLEMIARDLFDVDGNEFGSGSYDIFLNTDHPRETLEAVKPVLTGLDWQAGFKLLDQDDYTPIYPPDLQAFDLGYEVAED